MKDTSKLSSKSDQMKAFLYIGCFKNNEFRCILMPFSYIACGGSILQISEKKKDRRTKCLTTIHLICIISTVIYTITLPERGLTEPIFALDHGGVTL